MTVSGVLQRAVGIWTFARMLGAVERDGAARLQTVVELQGTKEPDMIMSFV